MACCAFALFIVGQIVAAFATLRRAVPFGLLGRPSDEPGLNPAAAWRLDAAAVALPAPSSDGVRWRTLGLGLALAVVLELALFGGAAAWAFDATGASQPTGSDTTWCWRISP